MRRRQLMAMAGWTGGTMAVALVMLGSLLRAAPTAEEGREAIQWPTLEQSGCQVTVRMDKLRYDPGDVPTAELQLVNATSADVRLDVGLAMMTRPQASLVYRVLPAAKVSWQKTLTVDVKAGESTTILVPTNAALAKGEQVSFKMTIGSSAVTTRPAIVGQADAPAAQQQAIRLLVPRQ